jgi:anhydro-N-acetylmuramic acid kinase
MTKFRDLINRNEFLAVGLMSGTSMDGVDAALVRMGAGADESRVSLVAFESQPYPAELRSSLMEIAFGDQCTAEDIASLHTAVAVSFSSAFFEVCRKAKIKAAAVDFIGSHGQTVAHVPPSPDQVQPVSGTLQLGPPGMIAALSGVTTVGDFRSGDLALGGQGAPLAPFADFLLRRSKSESRIILNIGGIANITYLPKNCGIDEVIAFDTGPGNMILDELYRVLYPTQGSFDRSGSRAASGLASESLVSAFLEYEFFARRPPKSAGHHEFGARFAWEFLARAQAAGLKNPDVLASATLLTTRSIARAIKQFVEPAGGVDKIFVSGGGSKNEFILSHLKSDLAPTAVAPIDELGIPADAKEAVDFAVLARETVLARPNVIARATGASKPLILGSIALGSET